MNNLATLKDNELIDLYRNGNDRAFGILVNRHKDEVFRVICLTLKDRYFANDIFQDLCIKVADKLKSGEYSEKHKFVRWFTMIAKNLCVDYFRLNKSPVSSYIYKSFNKYIDNALANNISIEHGYDQKADIKDYVYKKLSKAIDMLPKNQRDVIILRLFNGLRFKDIAKIENCSINTALGSFRYAVINLQKSMKINERVVIT